MEMPPFFPIKHYLSFHWSSVGVVGYPDPPPFLKHLDI